MEFYPAPPAAQLLTMLLHREHFCSYFHYTQSIKKINTVQQILIISNMTKLLPVIFIYLFIFSIIPIRSSKGVNKVQIIRQSSKNPLKPRLSRHPLNTAVANEKYFYHCCITSHFLVFLGISGFVSLCNFLLSGITWFIFA